MTNEITIDMIKVQHWKIYATHYEDMSLGIGLELKKMQFHYQQNECMGVPITWDILQRSRRPSIDDIFTKWCIHIHSLRFSPELCEELTPPS